ncbi:GntR family transcriptional regulator [Lactobacillus helveticus]|uniref:Transcriptional regulator n=1 Tax=Lactobacillus helveticus CIRM-BIA 104 TaxID=1226333 RepID=U6F9T1_LACHE|nr:GntR family transcriptional regulator [Lactobacillus helveticus]KXN80515.1 transcriptional regulator [Lactobacillus helveticus]MCT3425449.1 GntR family transcriptional regulator [Lactobacillus helveticus]CDI60968.1 Transcriptional regulator [Lactobacillus helveticus CIRM-BIA 104]
MPEQFELAQKYGTSRVTIVHALKILQDKKLIRTVKDHGTYITSKSMPDIFLNSGVNEHTGFTSHVNNALQLKSNVIAFNMSNVIAFNIRKPSPEECKALCLYKNDEVYDIIRQRVLDGRPAKLEYTVMPVNRIPGITIDVLHKSIYSYIQNDLGLKIGKDSRVITAEKSDAYDIKYLYCMSDDLVLCVQQKAFLEDGRPFELSESRNRYDRGALTVSGD